MTEREMTRAELEGELVALGFERSWVDEMTWDEGVTALHVLNGMQSKVTQLQNEVERLNKALEQLREIVDRHKWKIADMVDVPPSNEDVAYGRWEQSGESVKRMRHALCVAGEALLRDYAAWLKENRS